MTDEAFSCRMCGHCCHGEGGIVMKPSDVVRLASHLEITPEELLELHAEQVGDKPRLRTRADGYCLFFADAIKGCGVHPARPDVCRAWPFFRGNLVDAMSWEMIQDYCPGVRPEAGHAEFVRQGLAYLDSEGLRGDGEGAPTALTAGNSGRGEPGGAR